MTPLFVLQAAIEVPPRLSLSAWGITRVRNPPLLLSRLRPICVGFTAAERGMEALVQRFFVFPRLRGNFTRLLIWPEYKYSLFPSARPFSEPMAKRFLTPVTYGGFISPIPMPEFRSIHSPGARISRIQATCTIWPPSFLPEFAAGLVPSPFCG